MGVDDVVAQVGLWWPAADEDALRGAAAAWERTAVALDHAVEAGRAGEAKARSTWGGEAAEAFELEWRSHEQALRADAAGARALAGALERYAEAVAEAKRQVEELAVTAGATIVAGVALAWVTFDASAAAVGGISASLVAAAAAVGVELSATATAITAGAVVGVTFGAVDAAVVDMAVTQPLRVEVFGHGGYSASEVGTAATSGGLFGGVLGGVAGGVAAAPIARTAAGDLSGLRAPGGTIRAALDPPNWGPQLGRFTVGVHEGPGAKFLPHELKQADLLAGEGKSVHARPIVQRKDVSNPDALVRNGRDDPGTYTEFKQPDKASTKAVVNSISGAERQLRPWGGGHVIVDGRAIDLGRDVAEEGLRRAVGQARAHGKRMPEQVRIILGDGSEVGYP